MVYQSKDIYVLELTVGFEPNIQKNSARKYEKYETILEELTCSYNGVTFINLSMGACGVIGAGAVDFLSMLAKLGCEKKQLDYLKNKLCNICLCCTYYIFLYERPTMAVTRTATVVVNLTIRGHFCLTCLFPHLSLPLVRVGHLFFATLFLNLPSFPAQSAERVAS